jgi:serine/threonine-protein phosphatase 2A regulatory subunit A
LKIFKTLFTDEQDAIRVLCLESLIPLAKTMSKDDNLVHNMPTLLSAGADKSWKVRLCFARNFAEFTEAFGKDITDSHLIQNFSALLSDNEPEVKNAAIHSLSKSIGHLSLDRICNLLLPTLSNQYSESQPAFKASTALALCAISTRVGTDMTMTKILPILRELLQDENSDVRLNVAKNLIKVADTVGPDLLSHNLIEILKHLSEDANWRVRMAVYETLGKLSVLFGEEVYMKHLEPVFMTYLKNSAAQVRETGINESAHLAEKFGRKWINDAFVQKVVKVYEEDRVKYNFRMTAIKSLASVMPHMASEDITKSVVPVFIKACNDKVPNVQFCVARTIRECKGYIDDEVFQV